MKRKLRERIGLTLVLSLFVLLVFVVTAIIVGLLSLLVLHFGQEASFRQYSPFQMVLVLLVASVIVGCLVGSLLGRFPLRPVRKVIKVINRLAAGDFSARLSLKGPSEVRALGESFNRMAEELGSIEVLRSDFVNNFSHEFKTPIVSIKGYSEMLKYGDLSQEEHDRYLDIIIRESGRLADLATNVLNLSKVEAQNSLGEVSRFRLTEQIRQCILLLEPRWAAKDISFSIEMEELRYVGNEELLSQVWINLLDNAVKFTPEGGTIAVRAVRQGEALRIDIQDSGCGIEEEALRRIFDKFYQADISHATAGNGLGLTLARRIVELHGGEITCTSSQGQGTTFSVLLRMHEAA